jgi:hypothetical protein
MVTQQPAGVAHPARHMHRAVQAARPPVSAAQVAEIAASPPPPVAAQPPLQSPATDTTGDDAPLPAALDAGAEAPATAGDDAIVDEEAAANDRALKYLHDANIAFNTPGRINRDETVDVELVLSRKESIEALKGAIGAEVSGAREGAAIRTASRMEAKLSGLGFEITPATGVVQAVGTEDRVIWTWQVHPKSTGPQTLTLTLTAKLDKHGVADKTLRAFTRKIDVEVTPTQVVGDFVGRSWQWLWGAILVPLAAAGRAWYTNRKRKASA